MWLNVSIKTVSTFFRFCISCSLIDRWECKQVIFIIDKTHRIGEESEKQRISLSETFYLTCKIKPVKSMFIHTGTSAVNAMRWDARLDSIDNNQNTMCSRYSVQCTHSCWLNETIFYIAAINWVNEAQWSVPFMSIAGHAHLSSKIRCLEKQLHSPMI